jgi:hypothetical protein
MRRSRIANVLVATVIGVVFLAGLLTSGVLAAVLLVAVAAFCVVLSATAWETVPPRGRRVRVLIVAVVLALAIVKIATR